jgi:hypothetical protein
MHVYASRSLWPSLFLAVLAACGSSKPTSMAPGPAPTTTSDPSCPVAVPGTSVTVEDLNNGAALVFITTGEVAELRRRVTAMAKMHNDHHASMGPLPDGKDAGGELAGHDMSGHAGHDMSGHAGHTAGGGDHAGHDMSGHGGHGGGMIGVHSKATASDVEGGAKLSFVSGAGDVAKLQGELRMHAQHLATGTCAMGRS